MSVELHLPDLPEVPLSLGPLAPRRRAADKPWPAQVRDAVLAYLPLLMMAALALGTWWLVKHAPRAPDGPSGPTASAEPDYTMTEFALERFDAAGRLKLRIEGARLQHLPATDRIEIDDVRIRARAADGRLTQARARRALGNGDGTELQLLGGAEVQSLDAAGTELSIQSEFVHVELVTEKVHGHQPVLIRQAGIEIHAAAFDYDAAAGQLALKGPLRAVLSPQAGQKRPPAPNQGATRP